MICRKDGRWGPEDWTQWPQWYFEEFEHFPYILRRPSREDLPNHPLRLIWWNMTKDDFIEESEYTLTGIGRLRESIVGRIYELRDTLMTEVYAQNYAHLPGAHRKMHEAAHAMRHASATLRFQPQTFANTVLTVVAFQRYYLETPAIIDKFSKYDLRIFMGKKHEVDLSIMGAITDRVTLVWELFEKGVPVWYVRTAMAIPKTINIVQQAPLSHPHPSCGVVLERWPGAPVFYNGPRSPGMYFATG